MPKVCLHFSSFNKPLTRRLQMFNHKLPTDFPMQTLRKKTSPCKYKNEPGRFLGEGVSFRAKLIGVLEVPEARGDRMCQEALADLKMAIRAAGEHKQRIQVHVAIDGLRLRDDKTGDSLYHHPVHKISFIAQDMTDSRAFGYIFGSPDTGHRFFGIKTDKAASQVVIAMRDLFQVVFELKKKEIELAKQQLEGKTVTSSSLIRHTASAATETKSKIISVGESSSISKSKPSDSGSEAGVAELVDLEQELSSLRRGLTQVEGLTPSSDPFGDSFIMPGAQKGLLPPPPAPEPSRGRNTPVFSPTKPSLLFDLSTVPDEFESAASLVDNVPDTVVTSQASLGFDVFTELDPLGTGRSKPYVDKKLFFQELKNPPKKVLKDLVPTLTDIQAERYGPTTMTSLSRHSGGSVTIAKPPSYFPADPFADADPFDSADPFAEPLEDPFGNAPIASELARHMPTEHPRHAAETAELYNGALQVSLPPEPNKSPRLTRQSTESSSVRVRPLGRGSCGSPPPPLPPKKQPRALDEHTDTPPILPPPNRKTNKIGAVSILAGSKVVSSGSTGLSMALPTSGLSNTGLSNSGLTGPGLSNSGLTGPGLSNSGLTGPGFSNSGLTGSGLSNSGLSGPGLSGPGLASSGLSGPGLASSGLSGPGLANAGAGSSSDEYLCAAPPPLPAPRRFDITLAQLLTCSMDDLAHRLRVPSATLSSMTLPQLTEYLRSYLAADTDRAHINVEPQAEKRKPFNSIEPTALPEKRPPPLTPAPSVSTEFKTKFEDDFAPTGEGDAFVANFDDFDKKANPSYDRYAAFREIQELEFITNSTFEPTDNESKNDSDGKEELTAINDLVDTIQMEELKELSKSPLKSLDELTLDSFNKFRCSVSPKPSQIDAKIEDIKYVMKNLQIEQARRSVSPRENNVSEAKVENPNDRYAALREITITEPQDEFESLPSEPPKERKKSDERSDGFDNSDFFDCIDNSSLSFSHVEEAFRKSPSVKEKEDEKKVEEKKEVVEVVTAPIPAPARISTGSISDVISGSSPETKAVVPRGSCRWAVLRPAASPATSDSSPRYTPRAPQHNRGQTSSSSRDVSPWEEEAPPRIHRPHRESRHNSSGSRECLDSGSGREKDKKRDKRERDRNKERDLSRDGRESERERDRKDSGSARERDRRDSGSGRDRRESKERDHRDHRRDRRSRERDKDTWDRETHYSRERGYRDSRSRERPGMDYREKERDRHRKARQSYDEDDDYSDGCGSGRSSPRDRWPEQRWRRDERSYGSLGWRETRRRADSRQSEDGSDRRYGTTLGWPSRRSSGNRRSVDREAREARETRDTREPRRRARHEDSRRKDYRFSNDFSPREREPTSPFDNGFQDPPVPVGKKRGPYASLEQGTRFAFDAEETAASPVSASSTRGVASDSPATRFRFDSDSISPRSMFEDDFTALPPRPRTDSIAEEDENDLPPLRSKPQTTHRDIKKSESVNIFTRDSDPFEGDDFFACTGSDRAARRENWPGDFQGFDNEHA